MAGCSGETDPGSSAGLCCALPLASQGSPEGPMKDCAGAL